MSGAEVRPRWRGDVVGKRRSTLAGPIRLPRDRDCQGSSSSRAWSGVRDANASNSNIKVLSN